MEISKTTDQALAILIALGDRGPMTPTELVRHLDMNRTVVHRLLATLHRRGFVRREGNSYRPGAVLLRIASTVEALLRSVAAPIVDALAANTGESVLVSIADEGDAVWLYQATTDTHPVRVHHAVGSRRSLAVTAGGRALLAYVPASEWEAVLARADDGAHLVQQIEEVRRHGYSLSYDELGEGLCAIAVPVLDDHAVAVAAVSITVPTVRASGLEDLIDPLVAASAAISSGLRERQTGAGALDGSDTSAAAGPLPRMPRSATPRR